MRLIFCSSSLPKIDEKTFDHSAPTIVVAPKNISPYPINENFTILHTEESLEKTLQKIYCELKINHLLIEGGSQLINSFLQENLWDEIIEIESIIKLHIGISAPDLSHLKPTDYFSLKRDVVRVYRR